MSTVAYSAFQYWRGRVTYHEVRERTHDSKGRERTQRVTWCGIALAGGWRVEDKAVEPNSGRCAWVKEQAALHRDAA